MMTENLTADDLALWRSLVTLEPMNRPGPLESQAVGIFTGPGRNFILARAHDDSPIYEYILLPRKLVQAAAGKLEPLLSLVAPPISLHLAPSDVFLEAPPLLPLSLEERIARFHTLFSDFAQENFSVVLSLFGAALDDHRLLLRAFAGDWRARVALVQGLIALLPAAARSEITFSTNTTDTNPDHTRVIFCDGEGETARHVADWSTHSFPEISDFPYVTLLAKLWQGHEANFIQALAEIEPLAEVLLLGVDLIEGLGKVAEQVELNNRVLAGEDVPAATLKQALVSNVPLSPDLRRLYAEHLLRQALDARDTEAALIVSLEMDADPVLDEVLNQVLIEALETQPDSVYVFIRTRLNDAMEADARWLDRLKAAALHSLKVAINDADTETIVNWLRLIAREPSAYQLSDVLHEGILAAQVRAYQDGELARQLILLAVKRDPNTLDTLLNDPELLAVLPDNMGRVLRDHAGQPSMTLQQRGPEMFLVAMARSARLGVAAHFTPEIIEQIWKLYLAGQNFNLPEHYRPESIIQHWISRGAEWLGIDALEIILRLMLADGRDELFYQFAHHLAEHEMLVPLLATVLHNSQRSVNDLLLLLSHITSAGDITLQQAADTYIELLNLREWRQAALLLTEQLARLIQQHPELDISQPTVWSLLDVAAKSKSEMVARVAARQLFNDIEQKADDEAELIDLIAGLYDQLQWSGSVRQYALNWWRDYVRRQPALRLGRIDKLLEGRRSLEEFHNILETTLAFRRMLGKRSLQDFAKALDTAFSILEDLAESFDPSPKRAVSFDEGTIRAEIDARETELSDQERQILAKNFKELAQLIGDMGDHRSKANLMRRGENIDRQLMSGEQQPASAVDAMKWMSGYLDGAQDKADNDEDKKN
jgi:hypothetical protein